MKRAALVIALSCLWAGAGCESMPGRPQPSDRPIRPTEVTSFEILWGTNCAGCHGADGTLGPARPLNDALYLAWIGEGNLRLILQQGVPIGLMPAFAIAHGGSLTDDQIEILMREMRERWGKAHPGAATDLPPYAAQVGDASRGAAVYREFCARCHGADGTGGEARGSIVDPSYLALVSNQALRSAVVAGRTDLGMPDFKSLVPGKEMTDEQIADVVAWLVSHRVDFPGQPFAKKEKETHG